ncbi:hypothetical protein N7489_007831 [Penicillium chrysogenum]|uniref:Uncharacterized protein n=1 Tax=Penicillium chrysogenum TaxID=5076 RepID=A0ABQ8WB12_PENCH|nr:uncharacterized protein N7489_007831 [Penicillium chrysogenum]KAJ5237740.1 hypothetical protein N7489_007831 [Penicillium chrysogenum]KAJ5262000.1 hypothetical protein N7505_008867 [Penicillium chrysogenum]KAJ5278037.1 hypothetical protein N7524_004190 [Penicillium chrysogenum]
MLERSNLDEYFRQAKRFRAYLQSDPAPDPGETGIFEILAAEQGRIVSALTKERAEPRKKSKRMIDEDSVNLSLVALLIAVAAKHPSLRSRWTPHRRPIKAEFANGAEMEAQVDGYFAGADGPIRLILEAKSGLREYHEPQVSMQETAEVVALIMTQDVEPNRPVFVISQDGSRLYITAAIFNKTYLSWIKNKRTKLPSDSFLQMNQYGPWVLTNADSMKEFAETALAIMLAVDS